MTKSTLPELHATVDTFKFHDPLTRCPITNSEIANAFTSVQGPLCIGGFRYSYSPKADYYFVNPKPSLDSLNYFYNGHTPLRTTESLEASYIDYANRGRRFWYANAITTVVKPYLRPGNAWANFGCGDGILLFHNRDTFDMAGVEISELAQQFSAGKGLTVRSSMADLAGRKFDLITAIDVIEHMSDPREFLMSLLSNLKDAGVIILRLPVIDGFRFNRQAPAQWKWVYAPYHLSIFSLKAVRSLAESLALRCEVLLDSELHVDFVGFCERYGFAGQPSNRFVRIMMRATHFSARPLLRSRYISDCVFVVLRR